MPSPTRTTAMTATSHSRSSPVGRVGMAWRPRPCVGVPSCGPLGPWARPRRAAPGTRRREGGPRRAPTTRAAPRQPGRVDHQRRTPCTPATGAAQGPHHLSPTSPHRPGGQDHPGGSGLARHDRPRRVGWRSTPPPAAPAAAPRGEKPGGHPPSACAPEHTHDGPPDARVPTASRRRRRTLALTCCRKRERSGRCRQSGAALCSVQSRPARPQRLGHAPLTPVCN